MHAALANGKTSGSTTESRQSGRGPALWCGVLLILFGLFAASPNIIWDIDDTSALVILLAFAGLVETFAGILDHRAGGRTAAMNVVLGLASVAVALLLLTPGWGSASSLVYLLTIWLLGRGLVDLLGSALMRSAIVGDARMMRASIDLFLGVLSWIMVLVVPWLELLIGWPESSTSVVRTLAGLSVVAAGVFLTVESRVYGSVQVAARERA